MSYTSVYPPAHDGTYVKATSIFGANYYQYFGTDPAKTLTGSAVDNSWADEGVDAGQKVNIDLGAAKTVTRVYLENYHHSGGYTDGGVKTFRVYGTSSAVAFANVDYADTTDLVLLGTITAAAHAAADVADPQYFLLTAPGSYQYYVTRFDNDNTEVYMGFRRFTLQEDGPASGGISLAAVESDGEGGGTGGVTAGGVEAAAEGSWGGGVILNNVTVAATGDDSIPMQAQGDWGFSTESGITMASHVYMAVRGDLGLYAESGISILNNTVRGDLGFSMESGIQMTASNAAVVQGDLGFEMESGIQMASHIAINVGGQFGLSMTSGIELEADISARAVGELGFFMESGITMYSRPQAAVEGELGFFMESGIIADGGDTCAGVLAHVRGQVC